MFVAVVEGHIAGAGCNDLYLMTDSIDGLRLALASMELVFASDALEVVEDLRRLGWRVCYLHGFTIVATTTRATQLVQLAQSKLADL